MRRVLIPSSALLWGLQFAFLNPALALILVTLYGATAAQVGWVLAVYNASGFVASMLLPAYADRRHDYLRPMLACGALTLLLAGVLALATTLPVAVVALVVLGGPAGVGSSLLYAHLRHAGARTADVVNTRAIVSVAWVAGPPLATVIIGVFGNRAILVAIAAVALLNITTTAVMIRLRRPTSGRASGSEAPGASADEGPAVSRLRVGIVMVAFVLLQATNVATVSIMTLFVTETLGLDVMWAGVTLGVSAGLEIPALLLIGRLSQRHGSLSLVAGGCLAGIAYYTAMAFTTGPVMLLCLQILNAWFFAAVAGIGITLFQQIIPRPGLASGLYANTRRIGAIVSGPLIALGSITALGYGGTFLGCAVLTVLALGATALASRLARRDSPRTPESPSAPAASPEPERTSP